MDRLIGLLVLALSLVVGLARAQSTAPATTNPAAVEQLLLNDNLKFPVPEGYHVVGLSEDTRQVMMLSDDDQVVLNVIIDPQTASLTQNPDTARRMGAAIVQNLRAGLEAKKVEMIDPPRLKRDEAFFIRIEDQYKENEKTVRRLMVFRVLGINLMRVVAADFSGDPERAAAANKVAERLVYQIRSNKLTRPPGVPTGQRPSLFRKAKVKLTPAKGWLEEKKDADGGVIATYREPAGNGVVSVRVLSMTAQQRSRDAVVAQMAREDLATVTVPDATAGAVEAVTGGPFASKSVQKHVNKGLTTRVENRVMIVGEMLLSVTSSSTEFRAEPVSKFADDLAATAEVFTPR